MKTLTLSFCLGVACLFTGTTGLAATPSEQARQILHEDGFWDVASTTGFYRHRGSPDRLPLDRLQAVGVRGAMLGIGTLTDIYAVHSIVGWGVNEVPPGLTLFQNVFSGPALIQRMLWEFDATYAAAANPRLRVALTPADVEAARRGHQLAIVLGLDTGAEIDSDLAALRIYQRLGLRKLALVHAVGTSWADSVTSKRAGDKGGLSAFGRQVVQQCNALGIMVDLSHASDQTFWDTLAVSTRPLIATHSGSRAVAGLSRNLTDEMLQALAAKGGMVGVCGLFDEAEEKNNEAGTGSASLVAISLYIVSKYPDPYRQAVALADPAEQAEARRELRLDPSHEYRFLKLENPEKIPVIAQILLNHLDHIVKVIGVDHVGIGTDLNLDKPGYPEIVERVVTGLVERGYSRDQIQKILYKNYLDYFRTVIAGTPSAGPVQTH